MNNWAYDWISSREKEAVKERQIVSCQVSFLPQYIKGDLLYGVIITPIVMKRRKRDWISSREESFLSSKEEVQQKDASRRSTQDWWESTFIKGDHHHHQNGGRKKPREVRMSSLLSNKDPIKQATQCVRVSVWHDQKNSCLLWALASNIFPPFLYVICWAESNRFNRSSDP